MKIAFFHLTGEYSSNNWKVYQNFEFILKPIKVNFTDDIFREIYLFIWESNLNDLNQDEFINDQERLTRDANYLFNPDKYIENLKK